jgi:MFS family permease
MERQTDNGKTFWPAILAATFCGVVAATNVGKMAIALPSLRQEMLLSLVAAGWVVSMFNTMALTTGLFFGLISDRFGPMKLCRLGLLFTIVGGLTGILSHTEEVLLLSRFLEGAGFISIVVSAPALISAASSSDKRRLALSVWTSYMPTVRASSLFLQSRS